MLDSITRKRIDNCRDILVGKLPSPSAQVEQITIALIYKFMDDMDRVTVEEYGGNPTFFEGDFEKYSWQNIYSPRTDAHQMLNLYAEGIQKMGQNPGLNPMFRSIFKDAYLPYRDPETLRLFLSTINEFSYEHSEMLGDAFEYLLSIMGSQGDAGQFRTPRHIIDFLVELVDPKIGETILDPACGTSGFLISAYKHILNSNKKDKPGDLLSSTQKKELLDSINGYDISPDMVRLSSANLFLHGFTDDELNIHEYDTLSSEDRWNEYYDVIIANPPFMTPKGGIRPHNRFSVDSNRAEVLFTNYIMEHLTPKGRAGIVVPEGIIFQSGKAYKQLRKALVEKYLIGVISLPSGVFNPYSGVKTSILILDKELSQKTDKIFFSKVENDGFDLGAQRREIDKNDLPKIKDGVLEYVQNLSNGLNEEHPQLLYVSKEEILNSSDVGLSVERYSKNDKIESKYEIVLIGDKKYFDILSGGTPKTSTAEYWDGDISWISLVDLPQDERITKIKKSSRTISELGLNKSSARIIPKNSVIVSTRATIGRVGINEIELSTNQGFKSIVIKDYEKVNPIYIAYVITQLKSRMIELASGGTFKEISKSNFETLQIPLPSLEIQKEIVEELEQYQKIIDGAKQVVDNYKPHIDIDPSWEIKELGKVYSENLDSKRKPVTKSARTNGEYPYYGASGIVDYVEEYLFNEPLLLISEDGANLITRNTPIAFSVEGKIWVNNHAHILKFGSPITQKFIENYINQVDISKFVTGSAQPKLNQQNLNLIPIPIPSLEIQQSIVERIERERQIIEGNKKLIEIYTQKIEDRINKIWGD